MTEQDYVAFCNHAHDLQHIARSFCADLREEQARQLLGFVRNELAATPAFSVGPAYDFLAEVLAEEVAAHEQPSAVSREPKGASDDLPF